MELGKARLDSTPRVRHNPSYVSPLTPWTSLLGGMLIGLASAGVLYTQGRIAGVSGICGAMLQPKRGDWGWRAAFVVGMLGTGALLSPRYPAAFETTSLPAAGWLVLAGLLVGFGTRLGNGCTSGHGVCGVSRLSRRSIVATLTFILTAGVTVHLMRHVFGVA